MKILWVTDTGAELGLAEALLSEGHEVWLYTRKPGRFRGGFPALPNLAASRTLGLDLVACETHGPSWEAAFFGKVPVFGAGNTRLHSLFSTSKPFARVASVGFYSAGKLVGPGVAALVQTRFMAGDLGVETPGQSALAWIDHGGVLLARMQGPEWAEIDDFTGALEAVGDMDRDGKIVVASWSWDLSGVTMGAAALLWRGKLGETMLAVARHEEVPKIGSSSVMVATVLVSSPPYPGADGPRLVLGARDTLWEDAVTKVLASAGVSEMVDKQYRVDAGEQGKKLLAMERLGLWRGLDKRGKKRGNGRSVAARAA